ncbi:hypothetical protein [Singulisphaera sp. GP187]|uniref:hypothetical protein n=1 Tax=Singulisphaera sp. GP187 TaxID=1882752 RepID=UPI0009407AD2|nr:hypothetical protein [Singulisphaera sp. GP187]
MRRLVEVRATLIRIRPERTGWGYTRSGTPSAEATALSCMGLLATEQVAGVGDDQGREAVGKAARWLADGQNPDGSISVHPGLAGPGWPTSLAIVVWSRIGCCKDASDRATAWLLDQKGRTMPRLRGEWDAHDTTLAGWPWTANTHSWIEPTAWSMIALRRRGFYEHPRVREALHLIKDRMIGSGGWNYGVKAVQHRPHPAQPAPTGLALLALAGSGVAGPDDVAASLDYLKGELSRVKGIHSVCWGLLGLHAWGRRLDSADRILLEAYLASPGITESAWHLSQFLLAASSGGPGDSGLFFDRD